MLYIYVPVLQSLRTSASGSTSGSFQVASLDSHGVVLIWTLIEGQASGDENGPDVRNMDETSGTELGLAWGARCKLMLTTRVDCTQSRHGGDILCRIDSQIGMPGCY